MRLTSLILLGVVLSVPASLLASEAHSRAYGPQSVVRAWSEAVNTGDNEGAARLFADGARVVQGNEVRRLDFA